MRTFVINLDASQKRLAFMRTQLHRAGVAFERVSAVDGRRLSEANLHRAFSPFRSYLAMQRAMLPGEIGCALSHLSVYRRMVDEHIAAALILEDDVILAGDCRAALARAEAALDPARAQVFHLSAYGDTASDPFTPRVLSVDRLYCADAYVITQEAARRILKANYPVITVADRFHRWRRQCALELYRVYPAVAKQDNVRFESTINLALPRKTLQYRMKRLGLRLADFLMTLAIGSELWYNIQK